MAGQQSTRFFSCNRRKPLNRNYPAAQKKEEKNMLTQLSAVFLALSVLVPSPAQTQELTATIGRLKVALGMSHADFVTLAARLNQPLTYLPNDQNTIIVWDGDPKDKTARALGTIAVKDGKIEMIFK